MESNLPQANTMNVGSSVLHNASSNQISGGQFSSSEGITVNIHQVMQRHRDESVDSSSVLLQGPQNLRGDRTSGANSHDSEPSNDREERRTEQQPSGNAIYERQLLTKNHGFPLWIPQPNMNAFLTHQRKGVMIGDLGRVTPYGAFDVLFNICKRAGPPDNPNKLPDGFEPLDLEVDDIHRIQEYTSDSYIASASVTKLSGLTFRCSRSEGAVLTMPDGAFHEDLRNIALFRDFAAENAESWYRFVNGPRGWELGNGELHLVTGCDKTTSWGLAAYNNVQYRSNSSDNFSEPLLRFKSTSDVNSDHVPRATYCWEHEGMVEVKAGPEFGVGEESHNNGMRARNQCTFIRSHMIKLSEARWAVVQSTLVSALDTRRALKHAQHESTSSSNLLTGVLSSLCRVFTSHHSTGSATMTDLHVHSPAIHPSTFLANKLLQKHPDAKVAIVHDDHWGAVVGENEDRMPTGPELWERVQKTLDIVLNCKGTIYLSERSTPLQQAPQLSSGLIRPAHNATHTRSGPVARCDTGTRLEVIALINQWLNSHDEQAAAICWLNGPAGCGKSALAQTIAEHTAVEGRLLGSFFFLQGSSERSHISHLISTLAHQISLSIPATKPLLKNALQDEPALLDSTAHQFQKLIISIICSTTSEIFSHPEKRWILVIDALDECEDKAQMADFIGVLIKASRSHLPFRVLLTSRLEVEEHIQKKFDGPGAESVLYRLDLGNFNA